MSVSRTTRSVARRGAGAALGLLLVTSCAKEQPPAREPDVAEASTPPQAVTPPGQNQASVFVSEDLRAACELPQGGEEAPRFDFDEANLRSRGENILDDVAACLKDGPMKGQNIRIVGRADARGSEAYNQDLGTSRAEAARDYLVGRGVPTANLNVVSKGEQGATGDDEASRELDRRVDLERDPGGAAE